MGISGAAFTIRPRSLSGQGPRPGADLSRLLSPLYLFFFLWFSSSFPPLKEPELVFHCKPLPDMRETGGSSCNSVRGAWHETMRLSDRERQRLCASCKARREARDSAPCDARFSLLALRPIGAQGAGEIRQVCPVLLP